jgi:hypothetical protein
MRSSLLHKRTANELRASRAVPPGLSLVGGVTEFGIAGRGDDHIDDLEGAMNSRFDRLQADIQDLNRKFDIVMQHITGQSST